MLSCSEWRGGSGSLRRSLPESKRFRQSRPAICSGTFGAFSVNRYTQRAARISRAPRPILRNARLRDRSPGKPTSCRIASLCRSRQNPREACPSLVRAGRVPSGARTGFRGSWCSTSRYRRVPALRLHCINGDRCLASPSFQPARDPVRSPGNALPVSSKTNGTGLVAGRHHPHSSFPAAQGRSPGPNPSLIGRIATATDERVYGMPVRLAQLRQRCARSLAMKRPPRCPKDAQRLQDVVWNREVEAAPLNNESSVYQGLDVTNSLKCSYYPVEGTRTMTAGGWFSQGDPMWIGIVVGKSFLSFALVWGAVIAFLCRLERNSCVQSNRLPRRYWRWLETAVYAAAISACRCPLGRRMSEGGFGPSAAKTAGQNFAEVKKCSPGSACSATAAAAWGEPSAFGVVSRLVAS